MTLLLLNNAYYAVDTCIIIIILRLSEELLLPHKIERMPLIMLDARIILIIVRLNEELLMSHKIKRSKYQDSRFVCGRRFLRIIIIRIIMRACITK